METKAQFEKIGIWLTVVIISLYSTNYLVFGIGKLLGAEGFWFNPYSKLAEVCLCASVIAFSVRKALGANITAGGKKVLPKLFYILLIVGLFLSTFYDGISEDFIVKHRAWGVESIGIQDIVSITETDKRLYRRKRTRFGKGTTYAIRYKVSSKSDSVYLWITLKVKIELNKYPEKYPFLKNK